MLCVRIYFRLCVMPCVFILSSIPPNAFGYTTGSRELPSTYLIHPHPVSFLGTFLILLVNRKSPLIRFWTIAQELCLRLPFPLCCTPWQFPERKSRWSRRSRLPGQSRALREENQHTIKCHSALTAYLIAKRWKIARVMRRENPRCELRVPPSIIHRISGANLYAAGGERLYRGLDKLDLLLVSPWGRVISWPRQLCPSRLTKTVAGNTQCRECFWLVVPHTQADEDPQKSHQLQTNGQAGKRVQAKPVCFQACQWSWHFPYTCVCVCVFAHLLAT